MMFVLWDSLISKDSQVYLVYWEYQYQLYQYTRARVFIFIWREIFLKVKLVPALHTELGEAKTWSGYRQSLNGAFLISK